MNETLPRQGREPDRIQIASDRTLDLWCRRLNVTHDQLREAVRAVGSRPADVEFHLMRSRHRPHGRS